MEHFVQLVLNYIQQGSYFAVLFSMILSNVSIPIPAELILGFSGYLVSQQHLVFGWVVGIAVLGELLGTTVMYFIGFYGGASFVLKYGNYVFLSISKVQQVQKWLIKYGPVTIFLGRILPVVRGLIPLSAGFLQVNFQVYILYIILSSLVWSLGLTYMGILLGENWHSITEFGHIIGELISGMFLFGVLYWLLKNEIRKRR